MGESNETTAATQGATDPHIVACLEDLDSILDYVVEPGESEFSFEELVELSREVICVVGKFFNRSDDAALYPELHARYSHHLEIIKGGAWNTYEEAVDQFNRVYETAFPDEYAAHMLVWARDRERRTLDDDAFYDLRESADAHWARRLWVTVNCRLAHWMAPCALRTIADHVHKFVNRYEPPTAVDAWLDVVWKLESCERVYHGWGTWAFCSCALLANGDRKKVDGQIWQGLCQDLPAIVDAMIDALRDAEATVSASDARSVKEIGKPSSGEWPEVQHSLQDLIAGAKPFPVRQHDTAADSESSGTGRIDEVAVTTSTIVTEESDREDGDEQPPSGQPSPEIWSPGYLDLHFHEGSKKLARDGYKEMVDVSDSPLALNILQAFARSKEIFISSAGQRQMWSGALVNDPEPSTINSQISRVNKQIKVLNLKIESKATYGRRLVDLGKSANDTPPKTRLAKKKKQRPS